MTVKFRINGVEVEAEAGTSLLDAIRHHGFEVPSLCHHEALTPYGACRLCLVEIAKGGRKKITTSCNYEVLPDIEVATDSPDIRRHRALVLELLLAEAPRSASLRKFAAELGVRQSRYERASDAVLLDEGQGCIVCGLCVRACEVMGCEAISLLQRGVGKEVGPPPGGNA
ncbi:MAG TPA: 2Fe-2S iron-sulfur cluster-binding protein, partial [Thermoleophilia bacterium]|nr:2Fe-2S iron-sulfur cluster-binding protein [Thermoleophilia bacterium]